MDAEIINRSEAQQSHWQQIYLYYIFYLRILFAHVINHVINESIYVNDSQKSSNLVFPIPHNSSCTFSTMRAHTHNCFFPAEPLMLSLQQEERASWGTHQLFLFLVINQEILGSWSVWVSSQGPHPYTSSLFYLPGGRVAWHFATPFTHLLVTVIFTCWTDSLCTFFVRNKNRNAHASGP